jgi:hypothetical protein
MYVSCWRNKGYEHKRRQYEIQSLGLTALGVAFNINYKIKESIDLAK